MNFGFLKSPPPYRKSKWPDCRHNIGTKSRSCCGKPANDGRIGRRLSRNSPSRDTPAAICSASAAACSPKPGRRTGKPCSKSDGRLPRRSALAGLPVAVGRPALQHGRRLLPRDACSESGAENLPAQLRRVLRESAGSPRATDLRTETASTLCGQRVSDVVADCCFGDGAVCLGIELCEDLWVPVPPSSLAGRPPERNVLDQPVGKQRNGRQTRLSARTGRDSSPPAPYRPTSTASAGYGESTTDVVFAGNAHDRRKRHPCWKRPNASRPPSSRLVCCDIDLERSAPRCAAKPTRSPTTVLCPNSGLFLSNCSNTDRQYPLLRRYDPLPFVSVRRRRQAPPVRRNLQHPMRRTGPTHPPYERPVGRHRHLGRTRLHAGPARHGRNVRPAGHLPQTHSGRHDAGLRHDGPHLRQCHRPHAGPRRRNPRDEHPGRLPAAFRLT